MFWPFQFSNNLFGISEPFHSESLHPPQTHPLNLFLQTPRHLLARRDYRQCQQLKSDEDLWKLAQRQPLHHRALWSRRLCEFLSQGTLQIVDAGRYSKHAMNNHSTT
jgi:hypothetical protein